MTNQFSWLPSVEEVLASEAVQQLTTLPRPLVADAVRQVLADCRQTIAQGQTLAQSKEELRNRLYQQAAKAAADSCRPKLRPVINATGIVLHTNLGRAPLSEAAKEAVLGVASGWCNLELDLGTGVRSSRYQNVEGLLQKLSGAEDCLVVNNNAGAVLLALDTMAKGKECIISRGQLVEIGGAFRVPDIMAQSGGFLKEIGTTNKTHFTDYVNAITEQTGLLLLVHRSNFHMTGFVEDVGLKELADLGKQHRIPTLYDWGSGCLYPLKEAGLGSEYTLEEVMSSGVDVVTFSGDKLLGGPQAGIILGKREYVQKMKKNPLTRALRVDKMTLAALEATLRSYTEPDKALQDIPVLRLLTKTPAEIQAQAGQMVAALEGQLGGWQLRTRATEGEVGGGSMPDVRLPSATVEVKPQHGGESQVAEALRQGNPAILSYIREGWLCFDLRTILPEQQEQVVAALKEVASRYA